MPSPLVLTREFSIPIEDALIGSRGIRIAHISDLHFRHWDRVVEAAQKLLRSLDYDLLAVTGDCGAGRWWWRRAAELMRRFFEPLRRDVPTFAVLGNHDHPRLATAPGIPLEFLKNRSRTVELGGHRFCVAGVDQSLAGEENLGAALKSSEEEKFTILLAHYPSTVYRLPPVRVALQLSGHTHGGQIRLPGLGCVWPHDAIPRRMARGLHLVGGTYVHISAGIGVAPPLLVRVRCPPEITVLAVRPIPRSAARLSEPCAGSAEVS